MTRNADAMTPIDALYDFPCGTPGTDCGTAPDGLGLTGQPLEKWQNGAGYLDIPGAVAEVEAIPRPPGAGTPAGGGKQLVRRPGRPAHRPALRRAEAAQPAPAHRVRPGVRQRLRRPALRAGRGGAPRRAALPLRKPRRPPRPGAGVRLPAPLPGDRGRVELVARAGARGSSRPLPVWARAIDAKGNASRPGRALALRVR